jgi:hypothetical protein
VRARISKRIEVLPEIGTKYYVTVEQAKVMTANKDAAWLNSRQLRRFADTSKRGIWEPTMSGYAGPLVMQLS